MPLFRRLAQRSAPAASKVVGRMGVDDIMIIGAIIGAPIGGIGGLYSACEFSLEELRHQRRIKMGDIMFAMITVGFGGIAGALGGAFCGAIAPVTVPVFIVVGAKNWLTTQEK